MKQPGSPAAAASVPAGACVTAMTGGRIPHQQQRNNPISTHLFIVIAGCLALAQCCKADRGAPHIAAAVAAALTRLILQQLQVQPARPHCSSPLCKVTASAAVAGICTILLLLRRLLQASAAGVAGAACKPDSMAALACRKLVITQGAGAAVAAAGCRRIRQRNSCCLQPCCDCCCADVCYCICTRTAWGGHCTCSSSLTQLARA
jgi:hypothetical protein